MKAAIGGLSRGQKILLLVAVVCGLVNIPWYNFITNKIHRTEIKTLATVTQVQIVGDDSAGEGQVYQPIFEYKDTTGHVYHQAGNETFGIYNPLHYLFIPSVGQKLTAYYDQNDPTSVVFMYGIFTQTIPWDPVLLGALILIGDGVWVFVGRRAYGHKRAA